MVTHSTGVQPSRGPEVRSHCRSSWMLSFQGGLWSHVLFTYFEQVTGSWSSIYWVSFKRLEGNSGLLEGKTVGILAQTLQCLSPVLVGFLPNPVPGKGTLKSIPWPPGQPFQTGGESQERALSLGNSTERFQFPLIHGFIFCSFGQPMVKLTLEKLRFLSPKLGVLFGNKKRNLMLYCFH